MGYLETEGIILQRRDIFENDQQIQILTKGDGCIKARVPHARKSQKTFCGRIEPPNLVNARIYQAKDNGRWTLSTVSIRRKYAEILRNNTIQYQLWPILSLFMDLFPEGKAASTNYTNLKKSLTRMASDESALKISVQLLIYTAENAGVGFSVSECTKCSGTPKEIMQESDSDLWGLKYTGGILCPDCMNSSRSVDLEIDSRLIKYYVNLRNRARGNAEAFKDSFLRELESILYKSLHYHFDISLETLKVRNSL